MDYVPDARGFYIYRNAEYLFILQGGVQVECRIQDIRRDSLFLAVYDINGNQTGKRIISPDEIREIWMPTSSVWRRYKLSLSDYEPVFERTSKPKGFDWTTRTRISRDSSWTIVYSLIPVVAQTGLDTLHERHRVFRDIPWKNTGRIKRGVWFTPSGAYEIKGVNIGLMSTNVNLHHPQIISGVNLNADIETAFMAPYVAILFWAGNKLSGLNDSVYRNDTPDVIKGVSLSAGGVLSPGDVDGFSLNGGLCFISNFKGVVVTGAENINESFKGVEIGGLLNRSALGRGVQVGLLNVCKHLKGIQIGLWNVNSKRSLPIVNWAF